METLPINIMNSDRSLISKLKQNLLWCSRQGKLIDKEELDELMNELNRRYIKYEYYTNNFLFK